MTGNRLPFGPDELPLDSGDAANLATSLRIGRELEAFTADTAVEPSADFTTRVMAAVAGEPSPRPVAAAGRALAGGRPIALLAALRDAWRVAMTGGRPAAIRAQAMAFVLVALLTVGGVAGAVGAAAFRLLDSDDGPPSTPVVAPTPSPVVTPSPSPSPSVTPSPSPSPTVSPTPTPSAPPRRTPTPTPTETDDHGGRGGPGSTDDHGGGPGSDGGGGSDDGSGSSGSGKGSGSGG